MVVKKARGIAGAIVAASVALGISSAAQAHDATGQWPNVCNALPKQEVDLEIEYTRPITLPKEWRMFASATNDWLAVRSIYGMTDCIDLSWIGELTDFETFKEQRFAGFNWSGYEAYGYTLIDRAGTGAVYETGERPSFSPDGSMMAALEYSEAGYGGLGGFGVWMVFDGGLVGQYLTKNLPTNMTDWKIDRWEDDTCLHISAIPFDRVGDNWDNLDKVARDRFVAGYASGWEMRPGSTCPTYEY